MPDVDVLDTIRKKYGTDAAFTFNDKPLKVDAFSTGSIALDRAIGIGGVPMRRVTEIFGPESSGKSTICQYIIANAQAQTGKRAGYVDMEQALDPVYARTCGVDLDNLIIAQPPTGEQALDIAEDMVRSGQLCVVVVDSVAALSPKAEIEGEMGASHMGLQARLMGQALRKLTPAVNESNCALIFTNQTRQKIGIAYGDPTITPGGMALKFFASVRIKLSASKVTEGKEIIASHVKANVIKNKVARPYGLGEFDMKFGEGIDHFMEILDLAVAMELITKRGAFFSYGETRVGQGAQNAREFLKLNPPMAAEIELKIRGSEAPIQIDATAEEATV